MKLTVQRNQGTTRKGVTFTAFFHLALLPDEQELVQRYGLHKYAMSSGYTLQQLLQGVRYEANVTVPAEIHLRTAAVANINDALRVEQAVKGAAENCS